jgi:hypothetical protein
LTSLETDKHVERVVYETKETVKARKELRAILDGFPDKV